MAQKGSSRSRIVNNQLVIVVVVVQVQQQFNKQVYAKLIELRSIILIVLSSHFLLDCKPRRLSRFASGQGRGLGLNLTYQSHSLDHRICHIGLLNMGGWESLNMLFSILFLLLLLLSLLLLLFCVRSGLVWSDETENWNPTLSSDGFVQWWLISRFDSWKTKHNTSWHFARQAQDDLDPTQPKPKPFQASTRHDTRWDENRSMSRPIPVLLLEAVGSVWFVFLKLIYHFIWLDMNRSN